MFTGVFHRQIFLLMDFSSDVNIKIRETELILPKIRSLKHEFWAMRAKINRNNI
jgi:hypothetical protein